MKAATRMMMWLYAFEMSFFEEQCLQLLKLLISVDVSATFRTLQRKARVLKIRALRALDSAMDSCSRPADCAASRVAARPELWGIIAEHSGLVGAFRVKTVCRASREGATEWLRTLPGLVVCGGKTAGEGDLTSEVWRLDLGELRWERMSDLGGARCDHACCTVRGGVVVLAGRSRWEDDLATVEVLKSDSETGELSFTDLPPLSSGPRSGSIALPIAESERTEGQVLLLAGYGEHGGALDVASRVVKVDLATGACTPHPPLLYDRYCLAAARLPDGHVVCVGGGDIDTEIGTQPASITAEVREAPEQGSPDGVWRWIDFLT
jgi:hypothetical protein